MTCFAGEKGKFTSFICEIITEHESVLIGSRQKVYRCMIIQEQEILALKDKFGMANDI